MHPTLKKIYSDFGIVERKNMLPICAIKDTKTGLFDPPFTCRHLNEAIREFATVSKMPETKFGKHPADYELYHLGTYDDSTAKITQLELPTHLANGVDHGH